MKTQPFALFYNMFWGILKTKTTLISDLKNVLFFQLKNSMHNVSAAVAAGVDLYKDGPYPKGNPCHTLQHLNGNPFHT